MYKYNFSEESKEELHNFMKSAQMQKNNKFCDFSEYKSWKKACPIELNIENISLLSEKSMDVIELDSDSDLPLSVPRNNFVFVQQEEINKDQLAADDLVYVIKENLESYKELPKTVTNEILVTDMQKLEQTYQILLKELNLENVICLGESLENSSCNEDIISMYIQILFLEKLKLEYSDRVLPFLVQVSEKYSTTFENNMTKILMSESDGSIKVLLQYVSNLNSSTKANILRLFLNVCDNLCENYIIVIDSLLNSEVEFNTLNKLIELMSKQVNDFLKDKLFGKLLLNVLQYLGKNILLVENPLKHIIVKHSSIWKIKIQKLFKTSLEENMILSQSFR